MMIPSFVKFKGNEANLPTNNDKTKVTSASKNTEKSKEFVQPLNAEKWKEYVQPVNTEKWKEYVQPVNMDKWKEFAQPVNADKWKEYVQPVNTDKWKEYAQPVNTDKWKEYVQPVNTDQWKEYASKYTAGVGETRFNLSLPAVKDYNLLNFVDITAPSGVTMAIKLPFPMNEKGLSKMAEYVRKTGGNVEFGDKK